MHLVGSVVRPPVDEKEAAQNPHAKQKPAAHAQEAHDIKCRPHGRSVACQIDAAVEPICKVAREESHVPRYEHPVHEEAEDHQEANALEHQAHRKL